MKWFRSSGSTIELKNTPEMEVFARSKGWWKEGEAGTPAELEAALNTDLLAKVKTLEEENKVLTEKVSDLEKSLTSKEKEIKKVLKENKELADIINAK